MRRTRLLLAVPAVLLLASGCGMGDDAPHPGVAAEVDGTQLSLNRLDDLVDALCIVRTDDPQGQPTTRASVTKQEVTRWIGNTAYLEYADDHGIAVPRSAQDVTGAPGWRRMTDDQRAALQDLADMQAQADAVDKAHPGIKLKGSDYDIVVDPRFDIDVTDQGLAPGDNQLSVAVGDEAVAQQGQLSAAQLAALPDNQLCGKRPVAAGGGS